MNVTKAFFVMLMNDFQSHLRMVSGLPGEQILWLGSWNFQLHLLTSGEGREVEDLAQTQATNDLINHAYIMEPP